MDNIDLHIHSTGQDVYSFKVTGFFILSTTIIMMVGALANTAC